MTTADRTDTESYAEHVARIVATAPPLNLDQANLLRTVLGPRVFEISSAKAAAA